MVKLLTIISLILALVLFPPAALALVSNNAVPGDATYPVKIGLENMIFAVASISPTSKAWFAAARSDRRFKEIETLITQGKSADTTLEQLVIQTREAVKQIEQVKDPAEKQKLIVQLQQSIQKYSQGLSQLAQEKPGSTTLAQNPNPASQLPQLTENTTPLPVANETPLPFQPSQTPTVITTPFPSPRASIPPNNGSQNSPNTTPVPLAPTPQPLPPSPSPQPQPGPGPVGSIGDTIDQLNDIGRQLGALQQNLPNAAAAEPTPNPSIRPRVFHPDSSPSPTPSINPSPNPSPSSRSVHIQESNKQNENNERSKEKNQDIPNKEHQTKDE